MIPKVRLATRTEDMIIPAMAKPLPRSLFFLAWTRPIMDRIRVTMEGIPPNKIVPNDEKKPTTHMILFFCSGI